MLQPSLEFRTVLHSDNRAWGCTADASWGGPCASVVLLWQHACLPEGVRDDAGREPRWIVLLISCQVAATAVIAMAAKSSDVLLASG